MTEDAALLATGSGRLLAWRGSQNDGLSSRNSYSGWKRRLAITTMTALEAKNGFGQFLDAVQRSPVTVTKNGREVGAMFSKADLDAMGEGLLMDFLRDEVAAGTLSVSAALLKQVQINRDLEEAEADVAAGRVHVADSAFFNDIRDHIRQAVAAKR